MTMESGCEKQSTESGNGADGDDAKDFMSHPFICGICMEKFDQLQIFLSHFTSHSNIICNKNLHLCKCVYAGNLSSESVAESDYYKCRICKNMFRSICSLHSHILNCSSDGSYIFDNTRKMVYPLTLHCSYFESRDSDNLEKNNIECCNIIDKNDNDMDIDFNVGGMSRAEKIDYVLKNVCNIYGNCEKRVDMKPKKVQRKRRLKKCTGNKLKSVSKPVTLNGEKVRKNSEKNLVTDTAENNKENNETKDYAEEVDKLVKDYVVVKVEVEEKNSCDKSCLRTDISDNEVRLSSEKKEVPEYINDMLHDGDNDEDENDLTDEYTPPETCKTDTQEKVSPPKRAKSAKAKKKVTSRKIQKKQTTVEECPHCGKWLQPNRLKIHLVSHTDDRPYVCDQCPKAYKYQGHLESHKLGHGDVKPFYCEKCGKGYTTITMLKHHSMMHHSDSKPCVCSVCGASFITNYKLKRHMMKHTGEKCFQCDLCGMGFATRYNLSVHIQGVHKRNLRFTCTECGRNFMTNYQHKVHMMKHSGERPYKCIICRAEFIERKELRRHLKKQHSPLLEGNPSMLSELMDGCISEKVTASDIDQRGITFPGQPFDQVRDQRESGMAVEFIEAENEQVYQYENSNLCQPQSYYTSMKTGGVISNVKVAMANDYQINYPQAQGYSLQNSSTQHGVPLTVQETHDYTNFNYTLKDNSIAKDLSKSRVDKFDTTSQQSMHSNNQNINQDKNRTELSDSRADRKLTVL